MIVCCGEALIDMLPRKLPDGSDVLLPATGGAVYNTAIALGRLGVETGFFSGLSTDMFGRQLEADLAEAGVDASFCARSARPTTLAFVELTDGNARYTFYDEQTAGRMLSEVDLPEFSSDVGALHFGAISLIPEPCGAAYEALLMREATQRVISLDPNIRANFIEDAEGHRARMRRMIANSDIIKVSDEDLAWIEPKKSADTAIGAWIEAGASVVVMTMGADGARAFTGGGEVRVPVVPVEVVDTVGAGDSFDAGFLAGLQQLGLISKTALRQMGNTQLEEALGLATSVASIVVSRAGANPPWKHELP
jgi:fructokinase